MNAWVYVYIGINILNLGIGIAKHGQPREGNHSIWSTLIGTAIGMFILYKAGLFRI